MDRTRQSECAVAVPAGAANRHSVTHNTDGRVCDLQPRPVDRDEMSDPVFEFVIEEAPNPAQVPQTLFADIGDEEDGPDGFNPGFIERAGDGEDDGQAATIISDAGA